MRTTQEEIRRFEADLGWSLPEDYRDFLLQFNGGSVFLEHDIPIEDLNCAIDLHYLLPLMTTPASIGVQEVRSTQEAERYWIRQLLEIGNDAGTGFDFLMLTGAASGSIYFSFKDDIQILAVADWLRRDIIIPETMVLVAKSFDEFGGLILEHAQR